MADRTTTPGRRAKRLLVPVVAMGSVAGGVVALSATPALATTDVIYACAYKTNVSIYGNPSASMGCPPQTSPDASANSFSPALTAPGNVTDIGGAKATYSGAGSFFSSPVTPTDQVNNSGRLDVSATATATSVVSNAKATTVQAGSATFYSVATPHAPFFTLSSGYAAPVGQPAAPGGALPDGVNDGSTGFVSAKCTGTASGTETGQVTVKNGFVNTHFGSNGIPTETVAVPSPTPVNTVVPYWTENIGESGYIVFNERIANPDGTLSVIGAHLYMQGPTYLGDVIVAETKCGKI